jgi:signal peptidase I
MDKKKFINILKKTWHFIWKDDSLLSWIANIILAIILIKFVVYPGLGLAFGTHFPIVAVVSDSMEHENLAKTQNLPFDLWWGLHENFYEGKNISLQEFQEFPFRNGFNKGDLMVLFGTAPDKIRKGDILVFMGWQPDPIIHRVVEIKQGEKGIAFGTKGDNNQRQITPQFAGDLRDESNIPQKSIVGKAVFRIPYLGWVKIIAVEAFVSVINLIR